MVTSSAPTATRVVRPLTSTRVGTRHTDRSQSPGEPGENPGPTATGFVVRWELPDVDADDQQPYPDHSRSGAAGSSDPGIDLERIANAVEELLRAIAPSLQTRVRVEISAGPPPSPADRSGGPTSIGIGAETETGAETGSETETGELRSIRPVESNRAGTEELGLDLGGRSLLVDGRPVALTRREFDLLAYLQRHHGVALSRRDLMTGVWQTGYLDGDRTVDVHVRRVRMKLGRHAYRLSTLRGYGYRFD